MKKTYSISKLFWCSFVMTQVTDLVRLPITADVRGAVVREAA
jgi:hypothetical protein